MRSLQIFKLEDSRSRSTILQQGPITKFNKSIMLTAVFVGILILEDL